MNNDYGRTAGHMSLRLLNKVSYITDDVALDEDGFESTEDEQEEMIAMEEEDELEVEEEDEMDDNQVQEQKVNIEAMLEAARNLDRMEKDARQGLIATLFRKMKENVDSINAKYQKAIESHMKELQVKILTELTLNRIHVNLEMNTTLENILNSI